MTEARNMPDSVASILAPLTAFNERGVPVTLGTLWTDQPAVVAFVRHFG